MPSYVNITDGKTADNKGVYEIPLTKGSVIVAGLDMDYTGKPFGLISALLATAEYVTKVHAICMQCGNLAQFSHCKTNDTALVVLGETDSYEPLCRTCFDKMKK